eukprot:g49121.t1
MWDLYLIFLCWSAINFLLAMWLTLPRCGKTPDRLTEMRYITAMGSVQQLVATHRDHPLSRCDIRVHLPQARYLCLYTLVRSTVDLLNWTKSFAHRARRLRYGLLLFLQFVTTGATVWMALEEHISELPLIKIAFPRVRSVGDADRIVLPRVRSVGLLLGALRQHETACSKLAADQEANDLRHAIRNIIRFRNAIMVVYVAGMAAQAYQLGTISMGMVNAYYPQSVPLVDIYVSNLFPSVLIYISWWRKLRTLERTSQNHHHQQQQERVQIVNQEKEDVTVPIQQAKNERGSDCSRSPGHHEGQENRRLGPLRAQTIIENLPELRSRRSTITRRGVRAPTRGSMVLPKPVPTQQAKPLTLMPPPLLLNNAKARRFFLDESPKGSEVGAPLGDPDRSDKEEGVERKQVYIYAQPKPLLEKDSIVLASPQKNSNFDWVVEVETKERSPKLTNARIGVTTGARRMSCAQEDDWFWLCGPEPDTSTSPSLEPTCIWKLLQE